MTRSACLVAVLVAACSSSVSSVAREWGTPPPIDGSTPLPYNPALARYNRETALKNAIGTAVQLELQARGVSPEAAATTAQAVSGEGLLGISRAGWQALALEGLDLAVWGVAGCITASVAGGLPGCLVGALGGMTIGASGPLVGYAGCLIRQSGQCFLGIDPQTGRFTGGALPTVRTVSAPPASSGTNLPDGHWPGDLPRFPAFMSVPCFAESRRAFCMRIPAGVRAPAGAAIRTSTFHGGGNSNRLEASPISASDRITVLGYQASVFWPNSGPHLPVAINFDFRTVLFGSGLQPVSSLSSAVWYVARASVSSTFVPALDVVLATVATRAENDLRQIQYVLIERNQHFATSLLSMSDPDLKAAIDQDLRLEPEVLKHLAERAWDFAAASNLLPPDHVRGSGIRPTVLTQALAAHPVTATDLLGRLGDDLGRVRGASATSPLSLVDPRGSISANAGAVGSTVGQSLRDAVAPLLDLLRLPAGAPKAGEIQSAMEAEAPGSDDLVAALPDVPDVTFDPANPGCPSALYTGRPAAAIQQICDFVEPFAGQIRALILAVTLLSVGGLILRVN